jgi:hypothetical protein
MHYFVSFKIIKRYQFYIGIGYFGYWRKQYCCLTLPLYASAKLFSSFVVFIIELVMFIPSDSTAKLSNFLRFYIAPGRDEQERG